MELKLKEAKGIEADEILKLIIDIFPNAEVKLKPEDRLLIAESNKKTIGFIHFSEKKNAIILQGIGVLPSFRNRGYGNRLLVNGLKIYKKSNKPILLKVNASNFPAIALYEKYGFFVKRNGEILVLERKVEN